MKNTDPAILNLIREQTIPIEDNLLVMREKILNYFHHANPEERKEMEKEFSDIFQEEMDALKISLSK